MFVMSGALGLVLALQVWLGVLLLFDSHHGPVTGFREPRASAGASHEGHRHGAAGEQAAVTVRMTDTLKYEPREVTIAAGETVTWDNSSGVVHTVTADPAKAANEDHVKLPEGGEPFDSGDIPPGATWSRTFEVPGDYRYFCIPHEMAGMVGTVHVKAR
jgi:plastocyanin